MYWSDIYYRFGNENHKNPDILGRVLSRIPLSNSTMGKCAHMQVIKQPEHGKNSTTKEQK